MFIVVKEDKATFLGASVVPSKSVQEITWGATYVADFIDSLGYKNSHQARAFQFGPLVDPQVQRKTEIEASKMTLMKIMTKSISNVPSTGFSWRS